MKTRRAIRATALAVAIATASGAVLAQSDELYRGHATPEGLIFEPLTEQSLGTGVDLVITGPGDFVFTRSYEPGMLIEFRPDTHRETAFPDGSYRYELTVRSIQGLQRSRDRAGSGAFPSLSGGSGSFTIVDGKIADPSLAETAEPKQTGGESVSSESSKSRAAPLKFGETLEQFISGDLTVHFSLCVGGDCATSETFGADTIRLKENNLRIHFDDTSNSASFPRTDWRIIANDQANGGLSRFSIEDASAGRIPFTIEANAPSNSLYVEDGGRVGFGTSTPVVELHTKDGDTPTLRLEQDGSSGFASQTWDIAGNETNFFVRDVSNGSLLPFKIRPGAATNSLVVSNNGFVGLGILSPSEALHIQRSTDARARVENTSDTVAERSMLQLVNRGKTRFEIINSDANSTWTFDNAGAQFQISRVGTGVAEFALTETGNGVFQGTVTANGVVLTSSRTKKQDIAPVDEDGLLDKVLQLPIQSWRYSDPDLDAAHIGPMAEDFHEVFGLGDGRHLDLIDTTGITIAALQAATNEYRGRLSYLDRELATYRDRVRELEAALAALRDRVESSDRPQIAR